MLSCIGIDKLPQVIVVNFETELHNDAVDKNHQEIVPELLRHLRQEINENLQGSQYHELLAEPLFKGQLYYHDQLCINNFDKHSISNESWQTKGDNIISIMNRSAKTIITKNRTHLLQKLDTYVSTQDRTK